MRFNLITVTRQNNNNGINADSYGSGALSTELIQYIAISLRQMKLSKVKKVLLAFWLSIGSLWLILEVAGYLGFALLQGHKWYGLIGFCVIGLIITFFMLWREGHIIILFDFEKPIRTKYKVIDDIQEAYEKKKYDTVVMLGNGLSRNLFLEGHYRLRYDVGVLVEEAASKIGDNNSKCAALIDYIGWSLVLLKSIDNSRAITYIKHGIEVAQSVSHNYWVAKGIRHLAAIDIIDKNYQDAITKLDQTLIYADKISEADEKDEMTAGIYYDYALAYYYLGQFDESSKFCQMSRELRELSRDKSRICRMFALEGKIQEAKNNLPMAKDIYRKGLAYAEEVNRKDEIIRNRLGLARVLKNEDPRKAKEHLKVAQELSQVEMDFDIYGKEEIPFL